MNSTPSKTVVCSESSLGQRSRGRTKHGDTRRRTNWKINLNFMAETEADMQIKEQRQLLPDLAMAVRLTIMKSVCDSLWIAAKWKRNSFIFLSQDRTMLHCVLRPVGECVCSREGRKPSLRRKEEEQQLRLEKQLYLFNPLPLSLIPLSLNEPLTPLFWSFSPTEHRSQGLHCAHTHTQTHTNYNMKCQSNTKTTASRLCSLRGQVQTGSMCY